MESLGLQEYLDVLPYPGFVLDCTDFVNLAADDDIPGPESIKPIAVNKAYHDERFGKVVAAEINENPQFRKWLRSPHYNNASYRGQEHFASGDVEYVFNFVRGSPRACDFDLW